MNRELFQAPDRTVQQLFDLSGRVAVITGGAGMLGRRHADAIAEAGGIVVIADLDLVRAEEVASEIKTANNAQTFATILDVTDPVSVRGTLDAVITRFGRVDILVNNAALTVKQGGEAYDRYFTAFEDYPLDLWNEALEVNMTGAFLCCQAFGKAMRERGSGVILNIASDVGVVSPDHRIYEGVAHPISGKAFNTPIGYAATKAAVISMTRYLATWWAPYGIRVNSLSPAGVYDGHSEDFVERLSERIPLGRMARRDEYKGAVLFLVSDASSFMTGANLLVDGGRTAW